MSQKIEGTPFPTPIRGSVASGQVARAGDARDKGIEAATAGDSLRLTGEATGLKTLQKELAARPAFDEARVQAVREALADGSYRIDAGAIASAMLELDGQLGR